MGGAVMMANDNGVIYTAIRRDRRTFAAAFPHHADPLPAGRRLACQGGAMTQVIRVTDDSTRAELEETLSYLNQGAKVLSRKGHTGVASAAYDVQHERINDALDNWCATGPNCRTCGRTKAMCDAEPRHCCPVCDANGHGAG